VSEGREGGGKKQRSRVAKLMTESESSTSKRKSETVTAASIDSSKRTKVGTDEQQSVNEAEYLAIKFKQYIDLRHSCDREVEVSSKI
jgi:hypothetical protein